MDFRQHANGQRIILCEPDERVLRAARKLKDEGRIKPILVGDEQAFRAVANTHEIAIDDLTIHPIQQERYAERYHELRKHKNITLEDAQRTLQDPAFYSVMLLEAGEADGLVCGASWPTANTLRPALQILREGLVSSWMLMDTPKGEYLFADCAMNVQPTAEELAQIAQNTAQAAAKMGLEPRIALLSHSTEGSASNDDQKKVMHAAKQVHGTLQTGWKIGGELQVDAAMDQVVAQSKAPHSEIQGDANIFIFPDLDAGNIGYKLVQRFTGCKAIGPILTNLKRPVNDLSRGCTADEIVEVAYITAWQS